jgi:nucleotide-binding universal stress UspA family protein
MKVLIAYDGSDCADSSLKELVHAGLPQKGEALIMMVAEVWLPPPSALEIAEHAVVAKKLGLDRKYMSSSQAVRDAEVLARKAAAQIQTDFPRWKVKSEAIWGSPAWRLFSRAEEWKADLIVVGSHGRSALGRIFFGSISQWLLNEARCSVRVARAFESAPDFPVRLLVGIDGSRNAKVALAQVAARNWPAKSEVRVVVVDQPQALPGVGELVPPVSRSVKEHNRMESRQSRRLADTAAKRLRAKGLRAKALVEKGDPKHVLVRIAEEWRADCIFLGATGLTNLLERFLLGSVAGAVAARAHCSVEIVRTRKRKRKTSDGRIQ